MCELFIELLTVRLQHDPVPCNLLHTLGTPLAKWFNIVLGIR